MRIFAVIWLAQQHPPGAYVNVSLKKGISCAPVPFSAAVLAVQTHAFLVFIMLSMRFIIGSIYNHGYFCVDLGGTVFRRKF